MGNNKALCGLTGISLAQYGHKLILCNVESGSCVKKSLVNHIFEPSVLGVVMG